MRLLFIFIILRFCKHKGSKNQHNPMTDLLKRKTNKYN